MFTLIAELSTSFGSDVDLAQRMMRAAADAGATHIKTQAFEPSSVNPKDPQAEWLKAAALSEASHMRLHRIAQALGVTYMSTPFTWNALSMLRAIGVTHFKIASTESNNKWWSPIVHDHERWFVSYPWGCGAEDAPAWYTKLTAIPLYPTPIECVSRSVLLDGWSDHTEGLSAVFHAISRGARTIEVHVTTEGARQCVWDKSMDDLRRIREYAEDVQTMGDSISRRFRERWLRSA